MPRNIHYGYYEDNYIKHECQSCKRCFIVGEVLSENMNLTCPYCQSSNIEITAAATEENTEDMDMGCAGIYFNRYDDGTLMLYTEHEFERALNNSLEHGGCNGIPMGAASDIIRDYCAERDGRNIKAI